MEHRPVLSLPRSSTEWIVEAATLVGLFWSVLIVARSWSGLPETIPIHFGLSGEPDSWGAKSWILLSPAVCVLVYVGMTVLGRYAHVYNYPWAITEENAPTQYRLARELTTWLKAEIVWLFAFAARFTVRMASEGTGQISPAFVAFIVGSMMVILGTVVLYVYRARQHRQG